MKISTFESGFYSISSIRNNDKGTKKEQYGANLNKKDMNTTENSVTKNVLTQKENIVDEFVFKSIISDELEIYEKNKIDPINTPYEDKNKLEELLKLLNESKNTLHGLSKEELEMRDLLIEKINSFFEMEDTQGEHRLNESLWQSARESAKSSSAQAEAQAEAMKEMRTCLEIATKIGKGTASPKEMRFLLEKSPNMYKMAMALQQLKERNKNNEGNKTTTDIEEDEKVALSVAKTLENIKSADGESSRAIASSDISVSAVDFL